MEKQTLIAEIKSLILLECDKEDEIDVSDITDDEPLIGGNTQLALDSLDTLQLSLAIKKAYNVRIEGIKEGRKAFASINAMADYVLERSS